MPFANMVSVWDGKLTARQRDARMLLGIAMNNYSFCYFTTMSLMFIDNYYFQVNQKYFVNMFNGCLQSFRITSSLVIAFVILLTGSPTSLVVRVASAASHVSEFDIVEELSPRSFVGSVRTNPDVVELLNGTTGNALRFNFRYPNGATTSLFTIDDRSGEIKTSRRIDREQLCPSSTLPCYISFDVTVLPREQTISQWRLNFNAKIYCDSLCL